MTKGYAISGLTFELVIRETIPLLEHEQLHEHDHIGMRTTALIAIARIQRRQSGTEEFPIDQIEDLIERIAAGGDGRILLVKNKGPERAHGERSIEKGIKASWNL